MSIILAVCAAYVSGLLTGAGFVAWLAVREERAANWRVARPLGWRMRRLWRAGGW